MDIHGGLFIWALNVGSPHGVCLSGSCVQNAVWRRQGWGHPGIQVTVFSALGLRRKHGCSEWPLHWQVGDMKSLRVLAVSVCALVWACINVPEIEVVPDPPDAGDVRPVVTLTLSRTVTNSDVVVRASVTGAVPDNVALLVDDVVTAQLRPPYELRWGTHALAEGTHVFTVKATVGERTVVSEARSLVVDRTAPRLLMQSPRPGDRAVSVHAPIQVVFSEALEPATVTPGALSLWVEQTEVEGAVHLSADGTTLTLTPVEQLPTGVDVSVTITDALADLAGNALEPQGLVWSWSSPMFLTYGDALSAGLEEGSNVSSFSLKLDGGGTPVVAFVDGSSPETRGVYVKRWSGTAWEPLGSALGTAVPESVIKSCLLRVSPSGELFVASHRELGDGGFRVEVHHWSGSSWSAVGAPVSPLVASEALVAFGFVVGPQGERYLVLQEYAESGNYSWITLRTVRWDGARWESLAGSSTTNGSVLYSSFNLMLDSLGRPLVTWATQSGERGAVDAHARRWTGTYWEEPFATSGIGASGVPMTSILDGTGRLVFARPVQDVPGGGHGLAPIVNRSALAGGWQILGPETGGMYPGVTDATVEVFDFDPEGRLVALLSEPEMVGGPVNHYVRRWDETSWAPVGSPLLPRPGARPMGPAQFFMTGPEQWVLARIEETEGTPNRRHLYVYRPNN
ncbi:hypothetical protein GCM10012319_44140 [Comamonas sp. KCTC 72670]|nr:hypothetical protein GCM10012319_44140 [Comamonas sp. KCTC 72670]